MKLNVGMLTGGLPFAGDSLERGSLGGSETAFLYAARELAKRGHKVRCWVNCERPGHYDGVDYLPIQKFNEFVPIQDFDVLISSRWPEYHTAPTRAAYRVLWLHDTLVDKARLMGTSWQTDDFWLLSDFHIENYCGKPGEEPSAENPHVPEIRPLVWKTSNGVDMDLIEANKRPKEKGKLIYTSRPERGLVFLIRDIFPRMLKERPDLKLYYANYSLEGMQVPDHVREAVAFCDAAAKQHPERIIKLGHLKKAELYQHVSSAELQVYPTPFPEISCLAAMEAQACGTPIVTTEDFALVETVGARESGVLIKGNPQDPKYQEEFAAKALRLLNKPEILFKFSEAGPKFIRKRGYTWPQVVESWEKRILEKLEERWQKNKVNVIKRLIHDGDLFPAKELWNDNSICAPEVQSLISEESAKADRAVSTHQDIETLPTRYSVQLPSFNSAMELLASCAKRQPVKVLDYQTGDVSLGLFLQPRLPNVELTLYATDDEAATRLQHYVEKQGLQNVKVVTVLDDTQVYDLVLLNRFLDSTRFPEIVIGDLVRLSHENTEVLTITRFGPRGYTLRESEPTLDRFWNFNFDDLKALFPLPEQEIQGLFVPGSSPYVGHWVTHAKVKPLSKYTVDLVGRIDRKRLFTRPYQSVGLGMIVKNEEDHLLRCLKAVRPYVDTIAIVDTGSTDKTLEIAEEFADKIIHHKFDNFGDARNVSKDAIDDDWFLWLDADEVLLGGEEISKHLISVLYNGYVTDQCVTGDTLVALPGEYVQIKDLVGRSSFLCWSYSEKLGKMVLSNVKAVVKTGHRKVVEVVMDSGVLRCTPDHPVMLRDGSYRPAGQLKADDRLMPFYRSLGKINGKRVYADGRVGKLSWFVHLNNGETVPEHRYVYAQANGGIPNGYVVHHKNEDHLDNRVDNLQAMTWGAHSSLHHKGAKRPEATRSRTQRNAMKQHNSQKYSREEMLELIARHNGNMTAAMRELGITAPAFYHRLKRLSIDVNSIRAEFPSKSGKGRKRTREEFVSPLAPNNHRVVEVREGGWEDVYDMEVDETHNFVANGVVVHNCHLMIDVHGTKDSPIRLFKNKPEYRFTGYIHEHAEDTSKGPFGHSIGPAINLEGIKLAHYGYPSEAVRRKKCSSRNMELLIRDLKDHPNRPVNWLLFLRDCLNIVKWRLGENKPIHKNSVEHALLNTAVAIHLKFFNDPKHKLYAMVDPMYQEALKILALVGLPFETRKLPPIEVQLGLRAAVAGVDPNNEVKPQSRWFIDHDHFNAYMQSKLSELSVGLGDDKAKHEEALKAGRHTPTFYTDVEAAVDLLTLGVGKFR